MPQSIFITSEKSFDFCKLKPSAPLWLLTPIAVTAELNHGLVDGKKATLYKVIPAARPGLYVATACSLCTQQKPFHAKKNRAKFSNGLTERIRLEAGLCGVWFLMAHYRNLQ